VVSPLEVIGTIERPSPQRVRDSLETIRLSKVVLTGPVATRVSNMLSERFVNGQTLLVALEVAPDPTFDWFASRNLLHQESILPGLFAQKMVEESIPELSLSPNFDQSSPLFEVRSGIIADGYIAQLLFHGGCYWQSTGKGTEEKGVAAALCEELFQSRFNEVGLYIAHGGFLAWHIDVWWDYTVIMFDKRERLLFIVTVTDSD
jgi:hypothetical protein